MMKKTKKEQHLQHLPKTRIQEVRELLWLYLSRYRNDTVKEPVFKKKSLQSKQESPKPQPVQEKQKPPVIVVEPVEEPVVVQLHEKKLLEKLFPKQRTSKTVDEGAERRDVRTIAAKTRLHMQETSAYKSVEQSNRWRLVSLLHPTTSSPLAREFITSFSQALENKLSLHLLQPHLPFPELLQDPIKTLSLADGTLTLFIGEEHKLSSLQQSLSQITGFMPKAQAGFSPCFLLGTYFDTPCFFLAIDEQSVQNGPFKKSLWSFCLNVQNLTT